MTERKLEEFLARYHKIGLDTSVFIFQVEENPKYMALCGTSHKRHYPQPTSARGIGAGSPWQMKAPQKYG